MNLISEASPMTRAMRVCGTALLSTLSAFGASQLAIILGFGPAIATLACIVAFLSNFSMLTEQGYRNLLRRPGAD